MAFEARTKITIKTKIIKTKTIKNYITIKNYKNY